MIILTENYDNGVNKIALLSVSTNKRLNTIQAKKLAKELKEFFIENDNYKQDYIDNHNFDVDKVTEKELINFFVNVINSAIIDGDSSAGYQTFTMDGKYFSLDGLIFEEDVEEASYENENLKTIKNLKPNDKFYIYSYDGEYEECILKEFNKSTKWILFNKTNSFHIASKKIYLSKEEFLTEVISDYFSEDVLNRNEILNKLSI